MIGLFKAPKTINQDLARNLTRLWGQRSSTLASKKNGGGDINLKTNKMKLKIALGMHNKEAMNTP